MIKRWWNRLWIRKDEFHPSLRIDTDYLLKVGIKSEKGKAYMSDLVKRRDIAHQRDIIREETEVSEGRDYYEVKCPDCEKKTKFTDEREDGVIECLHCDEEIEIACHMTTGDGQ